MSLSSLQLSLTELDNITPITLLHNSAAHLLGPSRTLGAIMCGYSGIRFFEPQVRYKYYELQLLKQHIYVLLHGSIWAVL